MLLELPFSEYQLEVVAFMFVIITSIIFAFLHQKFGYHVLLEEVKKDTKKILQILTK